jgi:hypothetical protein
VYISLQRTLCDVQTKQSQDQDSSKLNKVDGEGLIRRNVYDKLGNNVVLELPGYHIPNAGVRLLKSTILTNNSWRSSSTNYHRLANQSQ